jgi:hypothetical protein
MPGKYHTQLFGYVLLHPLDRIVLEFHNSATLFADEMVMMVPASDFKPRLVLIEVALGEQLAFLEQFQSTVNGRVTDMRIYFLYLRIKFLGTDMPAHFEEHPSDVIAWRRRFKAAIPPSRMKQFHPLLGLVRARTLPLGGTYVAVGHRLITQQTRRVYNFNERTRVTVEARVSLKFKKRGRHSGIHQLFALDKSLSGNCARTNPSLDCHWIGEHRRLPLVHSDGVKLR